MVVRLDLHQDVDRLDAAAVNMRLRVGEVTGADGAFDDRGVIAVSGQDATRIARVRIADHGEQGFVPLAAVDDPVGVEDLMAAVLGVRLREHHELDVGRLAAEALETREQVLDLVGGQRETQFAVCLLERGESGRQRDARQRLGLRVTKQALHLRWIEQHHLGHAIEQYGRQRGKPLGAQ